MSRALRGLLVGGGLAVLFFFAYITAIRLAFMLAYFSFLLLLVCWTWARVAGRGLEVTRGGQEGAYEVGQEFREKMEVSNASIVGVPWVIVEDRAGIPGYEASRVFSLPGRGSRRWTSQGRFTERGRYSLGPIRLTTGDPFGFFQRTRVVGVPAVITVYPRLVDVMDLLPGSSHSSGDSRVFGRFSDSPPDALGIREHDPSDGFNRIHWPSTARLGRPMSRSFERYEGADTLVVLDLAVSVHRGREQNSTLEHCVSLAASVTMAVVQRGQSVSVRCNDAGGTSFLAGAGPIHLRHILDFLSVAQATGTRSLSSALPGSTGRYSQQSLVVITPAPPGEWVDALAGGRDGGRRTTVLHVGAAAGDRPRLLTMGHVSWWELATGSQDLVPMRRAS